jgi:tellurite resistance protein
MVDDFFPEIDLKPQQVEAMARGLFAVARADGRVMEREAQLIADFYASTSDHSMDLAALERLPKIEGPSLALMLPTKEAKQAFLKTAILLGYADGNYDAGESKVIAEYAKALGMTDAELAGLESAVKEFLLGQFSHLKNTEAVTKVAKDLKF